MREKALKVLEKWNGTISIKIGNSNYIIMITIGYNERIYNKRYKNLGFGLKDVYTKIINGTIFSDI